MIKVTVSKKLSNGDKWTKIHHFEDGSKLNTYIQKINELGLAIIIEYED